MTKRLFILHILQHFCIKKQTSLGAQTGVQAKSLSATFFYMLQVSFMNLIAGQFISYFTYFMYIKCIISRYFLGKTAMEYKSKQLIR